MKTRFTTLFILFTLTLSLAAARPALASLMALDMTGSLGAATMLNGTPLGADTAYTLHAVFDSTPIQTITNPYTIAWFTATPELNLAGYGSFTGTMPVVLLNIGSIYGAGVADQTGSNYISAQTTTSVFDPLNPAPIVFIGNSMNGGELTFGGDILSNLTDGNAPATATITYASAVPEPSTYALLCISLGVVGYARKKMKTEG